MKFGIFVFGDNHPELGRSNQRYYEQVLTMAEWAEELAFDSFWLGEHHFYWYSTCVSPPVVIAALAQRTKKIRLGPAVCVLPFHNPLIVAEEYALADNLCGGRLDFAVGSGFSPVEFQTFGMSMEEAKERFWEGFDIVLKAWTQEQFSHRGKFYQFENVSLYMKPFQRPTPRIWMAASSDDTLVKAGELGFPIMGIPFARVQHGSRRESKKRPLQTVLLSLRPQRRSGHHGRNARLSPPEQRRRGEAKPSVLSARQLVSQNSPAPRVENPRLRQYQKRKACRLHLARRG